jgi:hypothetical protein
MSAILNFVGVIGWGLIGYDAWQLVKNSDGFLKYALMYACLNAGMQCLNAFVKALQ